MGVNVTLVGGWTNPLEKMRKSNWIISPIFGNHHLVLWAKLVGGFNPIENY